MSLWGGDTTDGGNVRRNIFGSGSRASNGVKLAIALKSQTLYVMDEDLLDVYYIVKKDSNTEIPRMEKDVFRLLDIFSLASTPATASGLRRLVQTWSKDSISQIGWWLQDLHIDTDAGDELTKLDATTVLCLSDLCIFVLGYYYELLKPLLITSELSEQEGIGSWGYNDIQILRVLRQFKLSADSDNEGRFSRHAILRLLAYMFAGAHFRDQLKHLPERAVGVLGKLAIVTGSMMGQADNPEKVEKFWLLDIDQSCIPSNPQGVIMSGKQSRCLQSAPRAEPTTIDFMRSIQHDCDFTSHNEPDWDYDVQKVLVGYRHEGRIVHRVSPIDSDIVVITSWVEKDSSPVQPLKNVIFVSLKEFHGGFVAKKPENSPHLGVQLIAMTKCLPKARTCVTAIYGANVGALSSGNLSVAADDRGRHAPVVVIA